MSFRDALLSAGLVDKKAIKKAEREAAARDRQRSREDRRKPKKAKAVDRVIPRTEQERTAAAAAVAKTVAEHRQSVRRGPKRWYYSLRDGRVNWLEIDGVASKELETGRTALVEHEGHAVLVDGAAAKALLSVDADAVRCLNAA